MSTYIGEHSEHIATCDGLSKLELQKKEHTKETEFYCDICNKYYASYKSFGNHTRSYHSKNKDKSQCQYCGNSFTRKDNLQQHIRLFHSAVQKTFPCKYCDKVFTSRNVCSKHKQNCSQHAASGLPVTSKLEHEDREKLSESNSHKKLNFNPVFGKKVVNSESNPHQSETTSQGVIQKSTTPVCRQSSSSPDSGFHGGKDDLLNDRRTTWFKERLENFYATPIQYVNDQEAAHFPYIASSKCDRKNMHQLDKQAELISDRDVEHNSLNAKEQSYICKNLPREVQTQELQTSEVNKALDCNVCNITFLSQKDYLSHKPYCQSTDLF